MYKKVIKIFNPKFLKEAVDKMSSMEKILTFEYLLLEFTAEDIMADINHGKDDDE